MFKTLWPIGLVSLTPSAGKLRPRVLSLRWRSTFLVFLVRFDNYCWGFDSHACLATSADVECMFSHAGLTLTKHRNQLSDATMRAAVVLGSWFKEGLVPEAEIIQIFNEKSKQDGTNTKSMKGKGKATKEVPIVIDD